jgi:acetyl-CoA synthetase
MSSEWSWEAAARQAGVTDDGRFNGGAVSLGATPLEWWTADGERVALTGAELAQLTARVAGALHAAGVRRGDRVAGLLGRSPVSFALPLATWRLGALYVPLFSGFGVDAIVARLSDSGTRLIVCDPANRANVAGAQRELEDLRVLVHGAVEDADDTSLADAMEKAGPRDAVEETTLSWPATVMYTSGTSGAPKGCVIPHRGVVSLWPYVRHCMALEVGTRLFSTADPGWSFGLYTTGVGPMSLGVTRILLEGGFDGPQWWRIAQGADCMASAPTGYRQMALSDADLDDPGRLRLMVSAGEPLGREVTETFARRSGVAIHDSYGLTELGMVVANQPGDAVPGSMGKALPGFRIELLDGSDERIEGPGEGRLAVADNGWLLGETYWGRDELWQERRRGELWATEDIVRRDEDGRYWYVGRADDMIVTAGYNVAPAEVEEALAAHPLVADAACIGTPDGRKGTAVAAFVVLASEEEAPEELTPVLRQWVGERIGWHAAPRRVAAVPSLPRTPSGKLRRAEVREWSVVAGGGTAT